MCLYPGNSLKEDKHYFTRAEYDTEVRTARRRKIDVGASETLRT